MASQDADSEMIIHFATDSQKICLQRIFDVPTPSSFKAAKALIKHLAATVPLSPKDKKFVSQFVGTDFVFANGIMRKKPQPLPVLFAGLGIRHADSQSKIYPLLHETFKRKMAAAPTNEKYKDEFVLAVLETVARHARKAGWKVKHTSDHNNRASSRYIEIPNVGICRLSNHYLTKPGYWNGQVVLFYNDCRVMPIEAWLKEVQYAAGGIQTVLSHNRANQKSIN